jgi:hypothetical protein
MESALVFSIALRTVARSKSACSWPRIHMHSYGLGKQLDEIARSIPYDLPQSEIRALMPVSPMNKAVHLCTDLERYIGGPAIPVSGSPCKR